MNDNISKVLSIPEVTNNGRPLNPSLSEDSVADTAISKRNSDGMFFSINLIFIAL